MLSRRLNQAAKSMGVGANKFDAAPLLRPIQGSDMATSALVVRFSEATVHRSFVSPNKWMRAEGRLIPSNENMCRVAFGISPLENCVYVDGLYVDPRFRRNGYGTQLLLAISLHKGRHLPIVVLQEAASSVEFWQSLRERCDSRIGPIRSLHATDFEAEQLSWHTGRVK